MVLILDLNIPKPPTPADFQIRLNASNFSLALVDVKGQLGRRITLPVSATCTLVYGIKLSLAYFEVYAMSH